ncbi:MAG: hypothetical protein H6835_01380 [Planctomycetes bacterium]|nr:hypothetical protein [Planctomycetota bacterium]
MLRGTTFVAILLATTTAALAQGPLTAQLVANDATTAQWIDPATGAVGAQMSTPPGPTTGTAVQVGYGGNPSFARYQCSLAPAGDGFAFSASSSCSYPLGSIVGQIHADLTLTIAGNGAAFAGIDALLWHGGDYPGPTAMLVDVGDDGVVDLTSDWSVGPGYRQHRLWYWDFADGDLVIRVRSDQASFGGWQVHGLSLDVRPWAPGTSPVSAGSTTIPYIPINVTDPESSNYALVAEPPAQPQHAMDLRATGMGHYGYFLVSDVGATLPLLLPAPWNVPSPALSNVLAFAGGAVTATVPYPPNAPTPREWVLPVPPLPPGLTFYVQHASANQYYAFWFGTTNVVRIDT